MENIEKLYEQIISTLSEMCTSTVAMAPYPTPVVGQTSYSYGKKKKRGKKQRTIKIKKAIVEAFEGMKQNKGTQKKAMLGYKYMKQRNKSMSINEKILEIADICEAIINEAGMLDGVKRGVKQFLGLEREHHPSYYTPIAQELRSRSAQMDKIGDQADAYHSRAARATGHRKQVNQENAMDKEREYGKAHHGLRKFKEHILDYFRGRGDSNPEAHKKLGQMTR